MGVGGVLGITNGVHMRSFGFVRGHEGPSWVVLCSSTQTQSRAALAELSRRSCRRRESMAMVAGLAR